MSTFSATTPVITESQEQEEREALSNEERTSLEDEALGHERPIEETEAMVTKGVGIMLDVLERMPPADKAAYLEARRRAPGLVQRESDPRGFLRCERYDPWSAARRFALYWTARRRIFGTDRAYRPMTLSGAMAEDAEHAGKGFLFPIRDDVHGRPVLYFDRVRAHRAVAPRESIVRSFFYCLHAMSQRETAQKLGLVLVINMNGCDMFKHMDRIQTKMNRLTLSCLPMSLKAMHLCSGAGKSVLDFIMPVLKQVMGRDNRLRCHLHKGSKKEVLYRLQRFGLGLEHVEPIYAGKDRKLVEARAWLEDRRAGERRIIEKEESDTAARSREECTTRPKACIQKHRLSNSIFDVTSFSAREMRTS